MVFMPTTTVVFAKPFHDLIQPQPDERGFFLPIFISHWATFSNLKRAKYVSNYDLNTFMEKKKSNANYNLIFLNLVDKYYLVS